MPEMAFFRGRRVLVTGHTGFKGAWLCAILQMAGAEAAGYALPPAEPSLFRLLGLERRMRSVYGDIRDLEGLRRIFDETRPEVVFHLAAQPLVREGYRDPAGTYSTNVMGTVHLLECVRRTDSVRSVVNVTTDKVYENRGDGRGYRETDRLNGFDPYASSKSCSELVTDSYRKSFFAAREIAVSTARAGNVIGGGDFAADRIIPDCVRAVLAGRPVRVRNPDSVRPYQHVLEPLGAYLLLAMRQYGDKGLMGSYNVGPDSGGCLTTRALAELFCRAWGGEARWEAPGRPDGPHEDSVLRLDCAKIRAALGWRPRWSAERAVEETAAWAKAWSSGEDMARYTQRQIQDFFDEA